MTNKALCGLIMITAVTFSFINMLSQQYLIAGTSFALGVIWLLLEVNKRRPLSTLFFLFFLGLAILGSLHSAPIPIILLGLSTDLAAWDLSQFQARIKDEAESEAKALLEITHLQRLAAITSVGFLIALLPTLIKISIDFVVLFIIILL